MCGWSYGTTYCSNSRPRAANEANDVADRRQDTEDTSLLSYSLPLIARWIEDEKPTIDVT
jgi:hypothetical protein